MEIPSGNFIHPIINMREVTGAPGNPGSTTPLTESDDCVCGDLHVRLPFPVRVRGAETSGQEFEEQTTSDKLSAQGICIRLTRALEPGTRLFLLVSLAVSPGEGDAARVAAEGVVRSDQQQADDSWGISVEFKWYHFLYAEAA